jgi:PKD repeat protein
VTGLTAFSFGGYEGPVSLSPDPNFVISPSKPVSNTPPRFSNLSSPDAVRFKWEFGDGESMLTKSTEPFIHRYNASGTFKVCLTAYDKDGNENTICKAVDVITEPDIKVRDMFMPGSSDEDSVASISGFAIASIHFTVFNRWGQKVFETTNRNEGWDGKEKGKGKTQAAGLYPYTLKVEFLDGTKTTKTGGITLIKK